ncbi:MAG: DUF488 domain-containing protein [Deltaproteobacteria bacterium]|mgnify:CR=1 FL=1|nr:DUF488 domain-containing protein [Deltaproteobacteria bacterium]MBW1927678.1 DUF488 domain-containing protein [Deltaproteobacteria bacterium]MBW2026331.1 DUF488 domain-containing protein [Deltaproteobacteria bacterium]MBW2127021.1 DUF488 domain-containing protein [Deltaproteobacteria bacterium]
MGEEKTIYTIGTSNRSAEAFFSLLKGFEIRQLVDIRRFPKSSRYPHFAREVLKLRSEQMGLAYIWMGDLLGGFRSGGYDKYRSTEAYQKGLEKLEYLGQKERTVFLCAERLPWKCHRLQVSRDLEERGWRVIHIIDEGRVWEPGR